jgi:hypothetical protein
MTESRTFGRRRNLPATTADGADEPISGVVVATGGDAASATAGWGATDRMIEQNSDFAQYLKITGEPTVIKVLDNAPYDNFVCHWIDEIQEGSKSIRCWGNADCPLCRFGDKPKKFSVCFNVITLEDPEHPALKIWEAGVKIARQLKDISLDKKRGPLNRSDLYFTIYKTQKTQKNTEYHLERIKDRDLQDEYGIDPLTDEQLERFFKERTVEPTKLALSAQEMREIVQLLMAD